jgi:hypothetical protein
MNKMSIVLKRQQLKKPCFDFNGEVKVWALAVILLWQSVSQTQHLILAQRV